MFHLDGNSSPGSSGTNTWPIDPLTLAWPSQRAGPESAEVVVLSSSGDKHACRHRWWGPTMALQWPCLRLFTAWGQLDVVRPGTVLAGYFESRSNAAHMTCAAPHSGTQDMSELGTSAVAEVRLTQLILNKHLTRPPPRRGIPTPIKKAFIRRRVPTLTRLPFCVLRCNKCIPL